MYKHLIVLVLKKLIKIIGVGNIATWLKKLFYCVQYLLQLFFKNVVNIGIICCYFSVGCVVTWLR